MPNNLFIDNRVPSTIAVSDNANIQGTIDNRASSNTGVIGNAPSFVLAETGSVLTTGNAVTYSQSTIHYSQAGITYGGVISSNEGQAPSNTISN